MKCIIQKGSAENKSDLILAHSNFQFGGVFFGDEVALLDIKLVGLDKRRYVVTHRSTSSKTGYKGDA
jgi:hypothetical protein